MWSQTYGYLVVSFKTLYSLPWITSEMQNWDELGAEAKQWHGNLTVTRSGFWSLLVVFLNLSVCLKFFRVKYWGLGKNTYHFSLRASISEGQHKQFYYIFGELSPGISLKKKVFMRKSKFHYKPEVVSVGTAQQMDTDENRCLLGQEVSSSWGKPRRNSKTNMTAPWLACPLEPAVMADTCSLSFYGPPVFSSLLVLCFNRHVLVLTLSISELRIAQV